MNDTTPHFSTYNLINKIDYPVKFFNERRLVKWKIGYFGYAYRNNFRQSQESNRFIINGTHISQ